MHGAANGPGLPSDGAPAGAGGTAARRPSQLSRWINGPDAQSPLRPPPTSAPGRLLPGQWIGLLLAGGPLLTLLPPLLHNNPPDLPPYWACLVPLVTALRLLAGRTQRLRAAAGSLLALWLLSAVALPEGLTPLAALQATLTVAQALLVAGACRQVLHDARGAQVHAPAWRLRFLAALILTVVVPVAAVAGFVATALAAWLALPAEGLSTFASAAPLFIAHLAASGFMLALALLLCLPAGFGRRRHLWGMGLAAFTVLLALQPPLPWTLYWLPPALMVTGFVGGLRTAAFALMGVWAALQWQTLTRDVPVFEGPEGFVTLLLFAWRLLVAAALVSVWGHRRSLRVGRAAHEGLIGATVRRSTHHLRRFWRPQDLSHPVGVMIATQLTPGVAGSEAGEPGTGLNSGSDVVLGPQPGASTRQGELVRLMACNLRETDVVAPLGTQSALALLEGLPGETSGSMRSRMSRYLREQNVGRCAGVWSLSPTAVDVLLVSALDFEEAPATSIPTADGVVSGAPRGGTRID